MKKVIIITTLIFLTALFSHAQDEKKINYRFSLNKVKQVVITTNGYTEIENSISNQIECELKFIEKGKIIGFSNKDELEKPAMISEIKDSILYISMNDRAGLYVIGISTYTQELKYRLKIPAYISVEIISSDDCNLNGSFKNLVLNNNKSDSEVTLRKDQIKSLHCTSSGKIIKCNGANKGSNYVYEGPGDNKIAINSASINIQLF